jgi:hypothetical protein
MAEPKKEERIVGEVCLTIGYITLIAPKFV